MYTTRSCYRRANFDINQTIFFEMLSADQCEEIIATAMEVLERTGAKLGSKKALSAFAAAGCQVKEDCVRIPTATLEWAIRTAPSRITLCSSTGKRAALLETANSHFGPGMGCTHVVDRNSGEPRKATLEDAVEVARICEAMDQIEFCAPLVCLDGDEQDGISAYQALITYSTKPVVQPVHTVKAAAVVAKMAAAVAGGSENLRWNPCLALLTDCDESLSHSGDALDIVMFAAENQIPVIYKSSLVSGQTAPVASAGTLVVAVANTLVALTLSQIVRKGAPFIAGGQFTAYDNIVQAGPAGAPESWLVSAGFSNILRQMRLPSFSTACVSDAKLLDAQATAENTNGILLSSLSGSSLMSGSGVLEGGLLASTVALAIANEAAGIIRRIMKSVEIDEDRIGRGVIDEVGPAGNYLGTDHTNLFFQSEQYWPHLQSRKRIDDWLEEGCKSMGDRSRLWVAEILSQKAEPVIDNDAAKALEDITVKL